MNTFLVAALSFLTTLSSFAQHQGGRERRGNAGEAGRAVPRERNPNNGELGRGSPRRAEPSGGQDRARPGGADRGRWDGDRRDGAVRRPPVVIDPRPGRADPNAGRDRARGGWRRDDQRGGLGAPRAGGVSRPPAIVRRDPLDGRRRAVIRPSPRPHDEVRSIYRHMPEIWPESPHGYSRWHRAPRRDHLHVTIGSPHILGRLDWHHRHETHRGRHWWHSHNGVRYCHYYDKWGYHWYGWYVGSHYYWTRWHNGYWWWHDPVRRRWCYWHENRWWYQDPVNVTVVYVYDDEDDRYYRYDDRVDRVVLVPETGPQAPTGADAQTFYSTDGSRMVQIVGSERNAYLHDTADNPAFDPVWLGRGVSEARFRYVGSSDPEVGQVLVLKSDGSFDLFDADGHPLAPRAPREFPAFDELRRQEPGD